MGTILKLDKALSAPLADTPFIKEMGEVILSDGFSRATTAATALAGSMTDSFKGGKSVEWTGTNGGSTNGTFARTIDGVLEFSPNAVTSLCVDAGQPDLDISFKVEAVGSGIAQGYNQMFDFRKAAAATGDCYRLTFFNATPSSYNLQLTRRVGTGATLSNVASVAIGATLRILAVGPSIKVFVNDVILWDITNTEITSGNFIGFSASSANRTSKFNDLVVRDVV